MTPSICCPNPDQPDQQAGLESVSLSLTANLVSPGTGKWRASFVFMGLLLLLVVGCGSDPSPTPVPVTPTSTPNSNPTVSAPTLPPTAPPTPMPTVTTPASTPLAPLVLNVSAPLDESGVEVGFARIIGTTSGTSVMVNGLSATLNGAGEFHRDVTLRDGVNLIEVVAADVAGQTASQQIVVFLVAPTAGLPFTLLYPLDGLEVSEPMITVVGVTRPDAVVGVNEVPAEVDGSGIFTATIALVEGPNLLEVVAADIEGNVRFQTSVVFYLP